MIAIRTTYTLQEPPYQEAVDKIAEIGNCCDELWIATYFSRPIEAHKQVVEELRPIVQDLRNKGIRVVIEDGETLGHASDGVGNPCFEKLVGSDGVTAKSAYCPAGKNLRAHMTEVMKLYASLQPYAVMIDDDFRLDIRWPSNFGCFCDNCVKEFNEKHATSYTRDELITAMLTDVDIREKYINHNMEHMAGFARVMSEAAASVCKDVAVGIEHVHWSNYLGDDIHPIFQAVMEATGKPPHSRAGAGYYNDHNPIDVFDKILNNSWMNSLLPDFVKVRRPEIENANHFLFGKSVGGTCVESSLNLAYGCNGLSYAIMASGRESLEARAVMWQAFRDHRPYWQGLIDDQVTEDGEKTGISGLRIAYFKDMWRAVIPDDIGREFYWAVPHNDAGRSLINKGIPLTYEDDYCGAYLLHPDIIKNLTDDNIRFLLTQNVYTDGASIQRLVERGFGDQLPVTAVTASRYCSERYTDHEANGRCAGRIGAIDSYFGDRYRTGGRTVHGGFYTFTMGDGCEALAHVVNTENASSVLLKTHAGGTWIAEGMCLWAEVMNGTRRSRMALLADYLCGDKVPARLESDDRMAIIVRAKKDGSFVSATLQNTTIGDSYPIVVAVKADKDAQFVFSRPKMADVACTSEYKNGEHFVSVPVLVAWQTGTLRIKK